MNSDKIFKGVCLAISILANNSNYKIKYYGNSTISLVALKHADKRVPSGKCVRETEFINLSNGQVFNYTWLSKAPNKPCLLTDFERTEIYNCPSFVNIDFFVENIESGSGKDISSFTCDLSNNSIYLISEGGLSFTANVDFYNKKVIKFWTHGNVVDRNPIKIQENQCPKTSNETEQQTNISSPDANFRDDEWGKYKEWLPGEPFPN